AVEEEPQALARLRHPRAEADRSIETRSHDRPGSVVRRCRPRSPRGPRPALNRHRCPAGPTGVGRPPSTNWRSFTAGEPKRNARTARPARPHKLAFLYRWGAENERRLGRVDRAAESVAGGRRFRRHWRNPPRLIP